VAARLANVFVAPGEVFDEVKSSPPTPANWLIPALILILVSWIGLWPILSQDTIQHQMSEITEKAIEKQIQKAHASKEQADQMREVGEKYGAIGTKVTMVVAPVFIGFATPFWAGLLLWLVGAKVLKGNFSYLKAVEVAGLANMILVLETIVRILLILATGNLFASPSLTLLIKDFDPQNTAHSLLGLTNVIILWLLVVRSIGLARLSGVSLTKALVWVFGIWALFTGLMIGFGFAMRLIFGR